MSESLIYITDPVCTDTAGTTSASPRETWGRRGADACIKFVMLLCTVQHGGRLFKDHTVLCLGDLGSKVSS